MSKTVDDTTIIDQEKTVIDTTDRTVIESNDMTVIENNDITISESNNENDKTTLDNNDTTVIENKTNDTNTFNIKKFRDYEVMKPLPTTGAEADIYLVKKDNEHFILKLYRHGIELDPEKVEKLLYISNKYPEDIIKIYEINKDEKSGRWYEIQEYAKYGSLKDLIQNDNEFAKKHIKEIIKEITLLLKTIHDENIIHRDIKPANILIRTLQPLDLIITDFGISSLIDTEASKIMTSKSGTRVYFAPESFSGVIGKEVDYWALGMIILEIFEKENIFKGLNEGMIAHEIFTKGVKVPDYLDEDIKLLVKGLLTRDPEKRWGYKEIFEWLDGKRDIPVYYVYSDELSNVKPYKFKGMELRDIKSLLLYMYTTEYYEDCKEHILRGYVKKWLENNDLYDEALEYDRLLKNASNPDNAVYNVFDYFVKPQEFIFMGLKITFNNLLLATEKYENVTSSFVGSQIMLTSYNTFYERTLQKNEDLELLLLTAYNLSNKESAAYLIKIFIDKTLAYEYLKNNIDNIELNDETIPYIYDALSQNTAIPTVVLDKIQNKEHFNITEYVFFKKDFLNYFLENQEAFGFSDLTEERVLNDYELYKDVYFSLNKVKSIEDLHLFGKLIIKANELEQLDPVDDKLKKEKEKLLNHIRGDSAFNNKELNKLIKETDNLISKIEKDNKSSTIAAVVFLIIIAVIIGLVYIYWGPIVEFFKTLFKWVLYGIIGLVVLGILSLFAR